MSQRDYTIRKALLIPLGLDVLLLFCLLLIALFLEGGATEKLIFTLFFLPALLLFLECFFRRVTVTEEGLVIRKLGRTKAFSWGEITHVGCLTVHRKVYLLLTTVKGFFIISNAFGGFSTLVEEIVARVETGKGRGGCPPAGGKCQDGDRHTRAGLDRSRIHDGDDPHEVVPLYCMTRIKERNPLIHEAQAFRCE